MASTAKRTLWYVLLVGLLVVGYVALLRLPEAALTGARAPVLPQLPDASSLTSGVKATLNGQQVRAYKWQDDNGLWHYGDTPPQGDGETSGAAEEIVVHLQTNILSLPPVAAPTPRAEARSGPLVISNARPDTATTGADEGLSSSLTNPPNLDAFLRQVEQARDSLQQRNQLLQSDEL